VNISSLIEENARTIPNRLATTIQNGTLKKLTFLELNQRINQICHVLSHNGVKSGDKVLMFVKPDLHFAALTFALFRMGAVPVFIDPGMGLKNILKCAKEVKPRVMLALPLVHLVRMFKSEYFKHVEIFLTTKFNLLGVTNILSNLSAISSDFTAVEPQENSLAAILFTSGGTGIPKGVEYTHKIFYHQTMMLKEMFKLTPNEIDVPGFPLFALFTLAIGMESSIPEMDPSKPAKANPAKLLKTILARQATFIAGSPAIWENLANYCLKHNITLPSVKYVVMFGAPVRIELHEKFQKILPYGTTYTPYGATECLPVSCIAGSEILNVHQEKSLDGAGICVGRAFEGVEILILKRSNDIIASIESSNICAAYEIGEIVVASATVTPRYFQREDQTKLAKIYHNGKVYHRMGDVGYLDHDKNLWFCGRKNHVVDTATKTYYPDCVEIFFNQHPMIEKTALIAYKKNHQTFPALVIERKKGRSHAPQDMHDHLKQIADLHEKTQGIEHFFFASEFPVDVRHNIKIQREKLSAQFSEQTP
jgi:acyl-CoA synthetase (AMP-forming)/AMP-acid ligase II